MLSLSQSFHVRGSAGEPLPEVWPALTRVGIRFLRGQLCLVAAGPGTGKSAFVLSYALQSRASCLYFSADSDAFIQLARSLAILGGLSMTEAVATVRDGDQNLIDNVVSGSPIRFSYDSSPNLEHIERQVMAYAELFGDYPELIVIDNALDVVVSSQDPGESKTVEVLLSWLHDLARKTGACVVVLHHVTGPYNDASTPIPLSGVKGQVGRIPEMILTLHKASAAYDGGMEQLNVSAVKNRGNRADPSGGTFVPLLFDGSRMRIIDDTRRGVSVWGDTVA